MANGIDKNTELIIRLRLVSKSKDQPLDGDGYSVRLYDKDVFNDDYLGESGLVDGRAFFMLSPKEFKRPLGLDDKPDFYFVVYRNKNEIFKSRVLENVDITDMASFIMKEGEVIDLGAFLIDV